MVYYKVLNADGSCFHGGNGKWLLPTTAGPGEPMPRIEGELVACQRGYHILRSAHLVQWLGPAIFEVEPLAPVLEWDGKCGTAQARLVRRVETWNDRTARLFAADCAERVLPIYERAYPKDAWPRAAIDAARRFARGEMTARATARAAAGDGAGDGAAAWAAAAAADAAWDAARAAERLWQTERLMQYLSGELA